VTLTLVANATPQQATPGPTVNFNVIIVDACTSATISFGTQTINAMTNTIGQAAALQNWPAAEPTTCGPMTYSIVEGYTYLTLN